jgi:hypothetical protein
MDRRTGGRTVGERETDMMKLIFSFRNFPNAPKNVTSINQLVEQQDLEL